MENCLFFFPKNVFTGVQWETKSRGVRAREHLDVPRGAAAGRGGREGGARVTIATQSAKISHNTSPSRRAGGDGRPGCIPRAINICARFTLYPRSSKCRKKKSVQVDMNPFRGQSSLVTLNTIAFFTLLIHKQCREARIQ